MKEKKRENFEEIRSYIKARHKLGLNGKDIYGEICDIFGSNKVSYRTVLRWITRFRSGQESLKDNAKSGGAKTSSSNVNVQKIKEILMKDGRYTIWQIACLVARTHHIVKHVLKMKKICARWIPHILTNEQKQTRVRVTKQLLKMFPKFDKKKMANIVTGEETSVYFFEPHRKAANKIWAVKHLKRPCIARRVQSAKKGFSTLFSLILRGTFFRLLFQRDEESLASLTKTVFEKTEVILYKTPAKNWIQEHQTITWQCTSSQVQNGDGISAVWESHCTASSSVFTRPGSLWLFSLFKI